MRLRLVAITLAFALASPGDWAQLKAPSSRPSPFQDRHYIAVGDVRQLADRATFDREFGRASPQLRFDKVYIESLPRPRLRATDVDSSGSTAGFATGHRHLRRNHACRRRRRRQLRTFDYELAADRAEAERAVRLAAKLFDEVILDDFFFYIRKATPTIAAKGTGAGPSTAR